MLKCLSSWKFVVRKKDPEVPAMRVLRLCPSLEALLSIVSCWLKNFCLVIDKYRIVTPVENIVGIKAAYMIGIDITTLGGLSISSYTLNIILPVVKFLKN
jgi:hypothetical protein